MALKLERWGPGPSTVSQVHLVLPPSAARSLPQPRKLGGISVPLSPFKPRRFMLCFLSDEAGHIMLRKHRIPGQASTTAAAMAVAVASASSAAAAATFPSSAAPRASLEHSETDYEVQADDIAPSLVDMVAKSTTNYHHLKFCQFVLNHRSSHAFQVWVNMSHVRRVLTNCTRPGGSWHSRCHLGDLCRHFIGGLAGPVQCKGQRIASKTRQNLQKNTTSRATSVCSLPPAQLNKVVFGSQGLMVGFEAIM